MVDIKGFITNILLAYRQHKNICLEIVRHVNVSFSGTAGIITNINRICSK